MSKLKVYGIVATVLIGVIVGLLVYLNYFVTVTPTDTQPIHSEANGEVVVPQVNSFEECVTATNLVFASNPLKCIAPNGKVFVNPAFGQVEVIKAVEPAE